MDPDEFDESILNETISAANTSQSYNYRSPTNFVLIPSCLICLLAIAANIFIAYIIIKYRNFRTITHTFILHWSICNAVYLILQPINAIVLGGLKFIVIELICIWFGEIVVFWMGDWCFVLLLLLDWYVLNYCTQNVSAKLRKFYIVEICTIWAVMLCASIFDGFACYFFRRISEITHIVVTISYILFIVILIVKTIKRYLLGVVIEKSELNFKIVFVFYAASLPHYVLLCATLFNKEVYVLEELVVVANAFGNASSIIILIIMYNWDEKFSSIIKSMWNSRTTNTDNAIDDDDNFETIDIKSNRDHETALI